MDPSTSYFITKLAGKPDNKSYPDNDKSHRQSLGLISHYKRIMRE
jgi:hypothetical protein